MKRAVYFCGCIDVAKEKEIGKTCRIHGDGLQEVGPANIPEPEPPPKPKPKAKAKAKKK